MYTVFLRRHLELSRGVPDIACRTSLRCITVIYSDVGPTSSRHLLQSFELETTVVYSDVGPTSSRHLLQSFELETPLVPSRHTSLHCTQSSSGPPADKCRSFARYRKVGGRSLDEQALHQDRSVYL